MSRPGGGVSRTLIPADRLHPRPHGCVALGCRETVWDTQIYLVIHDGVQRVLCDYHARRWSP